MSKSAANIRRRNQRKRFLVLAVLIGGVVALAGCASHAPPPGPGYGVGSSRPQTYQVVSGDTVYGISRRYGVPIKAVIAQNGLVPPFILHVGQLLHLPGQAVHVVHAGDTVYSIARRYGVDMNQLAQVNGLGSDYAIGVGQRLTIPGGPSPSVSPRAYSPSMQVAQSPIPVQKPFAGPLVQRGSVPTPTTGVGQRIAIPPPPTVTAQGVPRAPSYSKPAPPPVVMAKGPVPRAPARMGAFAWPLRGKILSTYGSMGKGQKNDGINIAAPAGTPVKAAESGVVVYAGNEIRGFGNLLLLKHQGGMMTAYAHNEVLLVGRGAVVSRGQTIARVGKSGGVSRPQLHFEIRKNGKAVDPNPYLDGQRLAMR